MPPSTTTLYSLDAGAEITLRGDSAKRAGGKAKAHEYRAHPPFH